jgi:AcrR family transcriptional regulator
MLYYHVGDKDTLYATVITGAVEHALAAMREAMAGAPDAEAKLRAVVTVMAETAAEHPFLPSLILREIASGGANIPESALRKMAEVFRTVGGILQEGVEEKAFRQVDPVITHMLLGGTVFLLVAGAPLRRRIRALKGIAAKAFRDGSPQDLANEFVDLLLHGLRLTS